MRLFDKILEPLALKLFCRVTKYGGEALIQEWYNGREALIEDGVAGASRFRDGFGRHGDFVRI